MQYFIPSKLGNKILKIEINFIVEEILSTTNQPFKNYSANCGIEMKRKNGKIQSMDQSSGVLFQMAKWSLKNMFLILVNPWKVTLSDICIRCRRDKKQEHWQTTDILSVGYNNSLWVLCRGFSEIIHIKYLVGMALRSQMARRSNL